MICRWNRSFGTPRPALEAAIARNVDNGALDGETQRRYARLLVELGANAQKDQIVRVRAFTGWWLALGHPASASFSA